MSYARSQLRKLLKNNKHITVPSADDREAIQGSDLEALFVGMWNRHNGPELEREVEFHPDRDWRFDFLHRESMTAFEIEGGLDMVINGRYVPGRHNSSQGFRNDAEKYNAAAKMGYTVIRMVSGFTDDEVLAHIKFLRRITETTK